MSNQRTSEHPVDSNFLERWSPRAFAATSMPRADLLTILEAARWAPSSYNIQPWRFLYSERQDANWPRYLDVLLPFNLQWAQHASALVVVLSDTVMPGDAEQGQKLSRTHSFDAGAAWAQLALQATSLGYHAHAMAGIDIEKTRESLQVPDHFQVEIAIAVGVRAEPSALPEVLREREYPSDRLPLDEIAFAGLFPQ